MNIEKIITALKTPEPGKGNTFPADEPAPAVTHDFRLQALPEPVAMLRLRDNEVVVEDMSDTFARALDLNATWTAGSTVRDLFGGKAVSLFRKGFDDALAGLTQTLRIPLSCNDKSSSRIFLFRGGEIGHSGGGCLVALERRSRSLVVAGAAQHMTSLNSHMFFVHDLTSGVTTWLNPVLVRLLALSDLGADIRPMVRRLHPHDVANFCDCMRAIPELIDGQVLKLTLRIRDSHGKWRSLLVRIGVLERDDTGHVRRLTGVAEDFTDHIALNGALESASQAVLGIEARERRRIARELHDSTAQHLVAVDLGLSSLGFSQANAQDQETLAQIRRAIKLAYKEIRSFSYLLHPPQVAENGLKAALSGFLEGFGHRAGLRIESRYTGPLERIPPDIERTLFRVAQEALMNIHRHAGADSVSLCLNVEDNASNGQIELEIVDNGKGMAEDAKSGVGLSGMKTRMEEVGGVLTVENITTGFRVMVRCPFQPVEKG